MSVLGFAGLFATEASAVVNVVACGTHVVRDVARLTTDLDCSAYVPPAGPGSSTAAAIELESATLDLAGFTLRGPTGSVGPPAAAVKFGLRTSGPCSVTGPGTITGFGEAGILNFGPLRVEGIALLANPHGGIGPCNGTRNVTVLDSTIAGSDCGITAARVTVRNSEISGNRSSGVNSAVGPLRVFDSLIQGNEGTGLKSGAASITVVDSVITGNGTGVRAGRAQWPYAGSAVIVRSEVAGNLGTGVWAARSAVLHNSQVTGNGILGVQTAEGPIVATGGSTIITGNGTDDGCGVTEACADLDSPDKPQLGLRTTCEVSHVSDSGIPGTAWSVCSTD